MPVNNLIMICRILNIKMIGTMNDIADRIGSFLNNLVQDEEEDEEPNQDEDDEEANLAEDNDQENKEEDGQSLGSFKQIQVSRRDAPLLSFRDVEDSISPFNGNEDYPVEKWIAEFEELAQMTNLDDLRKLMYAKKSLTGVAKLFIQSQRGITTWRKLKNILIEEFKTVTNSASIHKLLMTRVKRREESIKEYIINMREIGSRINLEAEVIIQYVIDGIPDESSNKIILYGAKNFKEFKEKVETYEKINVRKDVPWNSRKDDGVSNKHMYQKKDTEENKYSIICFNCNRKGHRSSECRNKHRGLKCYKCNSFGHVYAKCPMRKGKDVSESTVNTIDNVNIPALMEICKESDMEKLPRENIGEELVTDEEEKKTTQILFANIVVTEKRKQTMTGDVGSMEEKQQNNSEELTVLTENLNKVQEELAERNKEISQLRTERNFMKLRLEQLEDLMSNKECSSKNIVPRRKTDLQAEVSVEVSEYYMEPGELHAVSKKETWKKRLTDGVQKKNVSDKNILSNEDILYKKFKKKNRRTYNKTRTSEKQYKEEDLVGIKKDSQFESGMKLRPKFIGPYRVDCKVRDNNQYDVYEVGELDGSNFVKSSVEMMNTWRLK
ncbi:uncharacterized protein LOC143921272 [Arctopsyche grandis]|uniref:uncharacterized protein LOC143921272 n=1 Tax=Arctopsyche grandis TaxID=121162 RepID=UPI00406D9226